MTAMLTVEPRQPTILHTQGSVKLPGYELWMNYIENVTVVPTTINIPRFTEALSELLRLYPHAAGVLRHRDGEWEILLSNSAIPVEVDEVEDSSAISDNWVVQRSLRSFLASRSSSGDRVSSSVEEFPPTLLLFKLSFTTRETAIGVSWHHTLGDAVVLERFMRGLSYLYQGNDLDGEVQASFIKREFLRPSESLVERYLPLMPHLTTTYSYVELGERYAAKNENTVWIKFKMSVEQLRQLRRKIKETTEQEVSTQDVLAAYIVRVLNRCLDTPITSVTNAASYRNVPGSVDDPQVAGNAIYIIPTTLSTGAGPLSLADTACAIRQSIIDCRRSMFVEEYMAVASSLLLSAANNQRSMFFGASPGVLSINSNASIDWRSAHFGYPNSTRFYTAGVSDRYVRVFRSNPETTMMNSACAVDDSLDVVFAIPSALGDKVLNMIHNEIRADGFPQNIEILQP